MAKKNFRTKTNKSRSLLSASQKNKKDLDLAQSTEDGANQFLTTDQGVKINDDQNSLKGGPRGATLLEDFILREKITHFDHERIPERIVHARGSGAHGFFQLYEPLSNLTSAGFLNDTSRKTPVFVRFSTVAGSRGSSDLARDVRGFAVKFYTDEGNFDIVGNNMPVFFIQDAIKFPDLIHAVKPEPNNEMPQAASAHDTFWDFISLMPESAHMIMWVMSDRALPRSLRMMEGFGVHSFRLINAKGKSCFVKFHWKPLLGVHAVAWDEAQIISGRDPDFHRRDLFENIDNGNYPQWELGIQVVAEKDELAFDFDILDPTKLIPEEIVPVKIIGKMTLNRNPDNFFAETEQIAFHVGNLVPGIDFTNDPLMQGRLFSYTDTQLSRLGGPNFHEIPINRPVVPIHNNQRDGHMRIQINSSRSSYHPNTTGGGCPFQAKMAAGGFTSYAEKIDAQKIRGRSKSFFDHFSQAKLFFQSQSEAGRRHIIMALQFELSKVETVQIRERMLAILNHIDENMAMQVSAKIGVKIPKHIGNLNLSVPADGDVRDYQSLEPKTKQRVSAALNMDNIKKDALSTRKVAVLAGGPVDDRSMNQLIEMLKKKNVVCEIVSTHLGPLQTTSGKLLSAEKTFFNSSSVFYDAVYVPAGQHIQVLSSKADALNFLNEAYKHGKPIGFDAGAGSLIDQTSFAKLMIRGDDKAGILLNDGRKKFYSSFIQALETGRFWERENEQQYKR